jgi:hypothetical protein
MGVLRFYQLRDSNLFGHSAFHTEIISKGSFDPSPLEICLTCITHALTAFWRTFRVLVLTGLHIGVSISAALSPSACNSHGAQAERDSYTHDSV